MRIVCVFFRVFYNTLLMRAFCKPAPSNTPLQGDFWLFLSLCICLGLVLILPVTPAVAGDVYLSPQDFLHSVFGEQLPEPQALWLTGDKQSSTQHILGHAPDSIRVRYWQRGNKSAWILEEIGKTEPITAGFVVSNNSLQRTEILIYRESRGWEVRYPFFTDQFKGAQLSPQYKLDQPIDNISGATLSVNAIKRMARLVLYYARLIKTETAENLQTTQ